MRTFVTVLAITAFFLASHAEATVGGSTTINTLKYNPEDESVYYVEYSASGRGCSPELKKMSLATGIEETVYSCEQGLNLLRGSDDYGFGAVTNQIDSIVSGYKDLTQIDLKANDIAVDIDFVKDETFGGTEKELMRKHFSATVFQNGKEADSFNITGCSVDQPFVFAGYAIPGFNKKIMLLSSAKGDCFEGGYILENLQVVNGVDDLDRSYSSNSYKMLSPLELSEAVLVAYESEDVSSTDEESNLLLTSIIGIAALVAGVTVGRLMRRK